MNKQRFLTILVVAAATVIPTVPAVHPTLGIPTLLGLASQLATVHAQPSRADQPKTQTVYIARSGNRYHRDGCRYLTQGKVPMTLKDAKAKGYTPCKVCRPPA